MNRPPIVILAGGKGTRLQSVTRDVVPKPMVEVFGKPFLYWLMQHYTCQGFSAITINTGCLSEIIKTHDWSLVKANLRIVEDWSPDILVRRGPDWYYSHESVGPLGGHWVVNGDTFIPETLPEVKSPTILSCSDVDAGAQFVGNGKVRVIKTSEFYDIGTPEGLERFKEYFKTHPLYLNSVKNTPLHSYCGAI